MCGYYSRFSPHYGNRNIRIRKLEKTYGSIYNRKMHKPCLEQHAAFIIRNEEGDDVVWEF